MPRSRAASRSTGVISPSQITSNQNDYNPTGIASAAILKLSSDASRSLSGLAGGAEGRVVGLLNTGGQVITLLNESASSTAANRFALGDDIAIKAKQAVLLRYDGTASRWYAIARPVGRNTLAANRTYYVRTDGSDGNDGLSNASGGAFLTIQKAIDVVAALDISTYTVTIQLGNTGTFTGNVAVNAPWIGTGDVILAGDAATPANTVIANSGGVSAIVVRNNGRLHVKNFKVGTTTGGSMYPGRQCRDQESRRDQFRCRRIRTLGRGQQRIHLCGLRKRCLYYFRRSLDPLLCIAWRDILYPRHHRCRHRSPRIRRRIYKLR